MSETFKEFEQKIKNRKFAIDNSWRGETEDKETEYRTAVVSSENSLEQALPWELLNEIWKLQMNVNFLMDIYLWHPIVKS